jgi:4'-phosphopantetheinyl transferase EntD
LAFRVFPIDTCQLLVDTLSLVDMNKGKRNALIEHRKKQTQAKDKRRAERTAAKTAAKK